MTEAKLASQTLHLKKKETTEKLHYFYLQTLRLDLLVLKRLSGFPRELIVCLSTALSVLQTWRRANEKLCKCRTGIYIVRPASEDSEQIKFA
jgi:hypothetical protein